MPIPRPGALPAQQSRSASPDGAVDRVRLAELHDSMAALLASRGQWRQAYEHLRSAVDLTAEARELSIRDGLTERYNRRYLDQRLPGLAAAPSAGLAVALADIDWFKQVNDTFGHPLGDRVLQRVAAELADGLPAGGFCARYGGEEFALVLPGVAPAAAATWCENARRRVERHPWGELADGLRVTVSIGVVHDAGCATPGREAPDWLLHRADELLYAAKHSGRNAVSSQPSHRCGRTCTERSPALHPHGGTR